MTRIAIAAGIGATVGVLAFPQTAPPTVAAKQAKPASAPQSLCRADEQALFQCSIGRRKVALCAGQASKSERYVQYRYGRPGRVELAYPERGIDGLSWARTGYSGGGEMQVNFANQGYRYVLYSRVVRTRFDGVSNDPRFSAGLAVVRGKRILSDRECTDLDDPWIAEAPTERLLPQGKFTEWWDLEGQESP